MMPGGTCGEHVNFLGLGGHKDWQLMAKIRGEDYTFVNEQSRGISPSSTPKKNYTPDSSSILPSVYSPRQRATLPSRAVTHRHSGSDQRRPGSRSCRRYELPAGGNTGIALAIDHLVEMPPRAPQLAGGLPGGYTTLLPHEVEIASRAALFCFQTVDGTCGYV